MLHELAHPIVGAPLAGGPSTPPLAAAVSEAGGLGFLAAGYRDAEAVRGEIADVRARTSRPFGVNVFAPPAPRGDPAAVGRYAESLRAEAERYGVALGGPHYDDDGFEAKLELLAEERVPVVSFTFGCPEDAIAELRRGGRQVWVTVTTADEAVTAATAGADALVVQGVEAGGHRGSFDDAGPGDLGLLALLQLVGAAVDVPLVAAGGIVSARGVAAALVAGASAAQIGTALLLTPEAGTSAPHREALRAGAASTGLTRAFSGRTARGIVNRFLREHDAQAPVAYPDVHHLTAPLRAAARERGDADGVNLWAGQAYPLAEALPAAELVVRLGEETRRLLESSARRFSA